MSTFPQHWREVALRHISVIPIRNGIGEAAQDQEEGYVRYIRTTDIADLHRLDESKRAGVPLEVAKDALVADDDILMTAAGSLGTSYLANVGEPAAFAGYLVRWRVDPTQCDARYFAWWTSSRHHLDQIATGAVRSTIDNFNASKFRSMRAPLPPLNEQRAIADFLDRETAQIDAMIEAQEQLLRSVMERRAAIRRRGFFDLRETEATRPLKHLTVKVSGSAFPLDEQGEQGLELPFHKVAALAHRDSRGVITAESDSITSETSSELGAQIVPAGSSLMAKIGAASLLARVGINMHDCCIDNNMVAFVPRTGVVSRFLYHVLCDLDIYPYINQSTIPYMNERAIMNAPVPLPTLAEQQRLVEGFDKELAQGSILVGETETSIAVLRERREALITAAVTGRIDPTTGIERIDQKTQKEAS